MTPDNKDKEFYELGKKMFDHIQVIKARTKTMTEEDEAFEDFARLIEAQLRKKNG